MPSESVQYNMPVMQAAVNIGYATHCQISVFG
jgi:hypothetical protein